MPEYPARRFPHGTSQLCFCNSGIESLFAETQFRRMAASSALMTDAFPISARKGEELDWLPPA